MLVGFLKGLGFTSITRKVAEVTETDASQVEAEEICVEGYETNRGPDLDAPDTIGETLAPASPGAKTQQDLVALRKAEGLATKIDATTYECVRTEAALQDWVTRIWEAGLVAIDTETTSLDPMQAELVGISLATEPGTACYIPLTHKDGQGDLLGRAASLQTSLILRKHWKYFARCLKICRFSKIGQNLKYDWLVLSQHGVEMVGYDDTMLLSYVLDAGRGGHGMDDLAKRHLGHQCISYKELTGTGKSAITFDFVEIDKATQYAAEDADVTLRLWRVLKPRLAAEGMTSVYERLGTSTNRHSRQNGTTRHHR